MIASVVIFVVVAVAAGALVIHSQRRRIYTGGRAYYWPRCPVCGAAVDCIGRPGQHSGQWSFRCKRDLPATAAAPVDGHIFMMPRRMLDAMQPDLARRYRPA